MLRLVFEIGYTEKYWPQHRGNNLTVRGSNMWANKVKEGTFREHGHELPCWLGLLNVFHSLLNTGLVLVRRLCFSAVICGFIHVERHSQPGRKLRHTTSRVKSPAFSVPGSLPYRRNAHSCRWGESNGCSHNHERSSAISFNEYNMWERTVYRRWESGS